VITIIIITLALCSLILFTLAVRSRKEMRKKRRWQEIREPSEAFRWLDTILPLIFARLVAIVLMWQEPKQKGIPALAQILFLFMPNRNREHILGDLEEEYRTSNKRFPRFWYWGQVLALIGRYWWVALRRLAGLDVIRKVIHK
jgi:hypothetical protein